MKHSKKILIHSAGIEKKRGELPWGTSPPSVRVQILNLELNFGCAEKYVFKAWSETEQFGESHDLAQNHK